MKIVNKLVGLQITTNNTATSPIFNKLQACEIGLVAVIQGKNIHEKALK